MSLVRIKVGSVEMLADLNETECARKLLLRYIWGVQSKIPVFKKAAKQGTLFHRLLQRGPGVCEDNPSGATYPELMRAEINGEINNLMEAVQLGFDLTGELYKAATGMTEIFDKALAMANIFWTRFPRPERLKVIGKEIHIESEWNGMKIKGDLDEIVQNEENGDIWIRDTKTSSDKLSLALSGYQFGIQARFYRLLVHNGLYDGINGVCYEPKLLRGLILDIACVPGIKFCGKDADFNAYIKRVGEWYEKQDDKEAMQSKGIMFTEPLMNEELVGALRKTQLLMDEPTSPSGIEWGELYSRDITGTECKNYKRRCCYYELCSSDEQNWPGIIERDYEFRVPEH